MTVDKEPKNSCYLDFYKNTKTPYILEIPWELNNVFQIFSNFRFGFKIAVQSGAKRKNVGDEVQ